MTESSKNQLNKIKKDLEEIRKTITIIQLMELREELRKDDDNGNH